MGAIRDGLRDQAAKVDGAVTWAAEVKSLTASNEERQLRLALGQVMRYRQLLTDRDGDVRGVIAVEHEPRDSTWQQLCHDQGIAILWPGHMELDALFRTA